ncbi:enolase C-terminal domain-like protein [Pararhodobacter oceanensis]|uniref:enolase C-terminal domain-like protein n=1 Tax=Pararhodobacter oceanensis TaxID=2172121 RepID=UPI003A9052CA
MAQMATGLTQARIMDIREVSVPLSGALANAVVNFASHDVSLVAVISDVIRDGRPVTGLAFNSIGRFAQPGLLNRRFIPRLLAADPETLAGGPNGAPDPAKIRAAAMRDEKPGGHGDRASAVAALELAIWDLAAKLGDEPAWVTISRAFSSTPHRSGCDVYAAGGYYYSGDTTRTLTDELKSYLDLGFTAVKMKIGGAALAQDLTRVEQAIGILGGAGNVAVDANGRFDRAAALDWGQRLDGYGLRWLEEMGDPLDLGTHAALTKALQTPIATGENLFSRQDLRNLIGFGGARPLRDIFQMDAGLSYGLGEYAGMIADLEVAGHSRAQIMPHGGHLINLHIVTALGLGGCEAYPRVFEPFGGYSAQCRLQDGKISPSDAPGFGLEQKQGLRPHIQGLLE